jgi:hypothetical protein
LLGRDRTITKEDAVSERLYYARRTFQYDDELDLDRGQCFNPKGYEADEKLIRIGYMEEFRSKNRPMQCGKCGMSFIDDASLNQHGFKRHSGKTTSDRVTPTADGRIAEDMAAEAAMKRENEIAPLYTDKTSGRAPTIKRGPGRPRIHP